MKQKFSFMSMIIILTSLLTFCSCSKDDDEQALTTYYVVLDKIVTNCAGADGNLLTDQIYNTFAFENGKKYIDFAEANVVPTSEFYTLCAQLETILNDSWSGNLPEEGWIQYVFSLRSNSETGKSETTQVITIRYKPF